MSLCALQDAAACGCLADSIWDGNAPPFAGGAAAACDFWRSRVQESGDVDILRAAVRWMAVRVTAADAADARADSPASAAVVHSAWGPASSQAERDAAALPAATTDAGARDGNGAVAGADERARQCDLLLDEMQKCASSSAAGSADPVVRGLRVQVLLRCGHTQQAVEELKQSLVEGAGSCELWQMALRLCAACCAGGEPQFLGFGSVEGLVEATLSIAPAGQVSGAVLQAASLLRCHGQSMAPVCGHVLDRLATASMDSDGKDVAAVLTAVWCVPHAWCHAIVLGRCSQILGCGCCACRVGVVLKLGR